MYYKKSIGGRAADAIVYMVLTIITLVALYPIWHVIMASFSNGDQLMRYTGGVFWPIGFSTRAYEVVLKNPSIYTGYMNTIFYVAVGTIINLILTTLGAYALSRKNFLWRNPFMMMITITMFFSGGMIPTYLLIEKIHLVSHLSAREQGCRCSDGPILCCQPLEWLVFRRTILKDSIEVSAAIAAP